APLVACGCLAGERHEWGVLASLAIAQDQGWRVHYLGPDLPADQLVEAAWRLSPRAVALSAGDPAIVRAALPVLATLPARLPPGTIAILGGAGIEPHNRVLRGYGYRIGLEAFGPARR
ncbi:MAG: cobalamin-dependent protein, partial [Gemmatimonadales bacterium]